MLSFRSLITNNYNFPEQTAEEEAVHRSDPDHRRVHHTHRNIPSLIDHQIAVFLLQIRHASALVVRLPLLSGKQTAVNAPSAKLRPFHYLFTCQCQLSTVICHKFSFLPPYVIYLLVI